VGFTVSNTKKLKVLKTCQNNEVHYKQYLFCHSPTVCLLFPYEITIIYTNVTYKFRRCLSCNRRYRRHPCSHIRPECRIRWTL